VDRFQFLVHPSAFPIVHARPSICAAPALGTSGTSGASVVSSSACEDSKVVGIKYEVFGRVQGVSFRYHTHKTAHKLNVVGWVQNTADDTVIGEAAGNVKAIEQFVEFLSVGPKLARVDNVVKQELSAQRISTLRTTNDFVILK